MNVARILNWSIPSWLSKNGTIILLGIILLVGTALRLNRIDEQSLWFDELHSIIPTNPANSLSSVIEYAKSDQPPLFFVLLYYWYQIFPYDEASGKVLCAIIGILGIGVIFFLGKEIYGVRTGLAAAFLTATNLFQIYYSQELRFYSLLFLVSCLSLLFFLKMMKKQSTLNLILFCLASVAVLYTHYYGMVVVLSEAIIFLLITFIYQKGFIFFLKGVLCAGITFLAFMPWMFNVIRDSKVTEFWIENPGPFFFAEYFNRYFNGWWGLAFKVYFSWLLFTVLLFGLWLLIKDLKDRKNERECMPQIVLFCWGLFTWLIPYLYTILKLPMLMDRYTIITLPSILIMIAIGWTRINNIKMKIGLALVFIFFTWRADHRYFYSFKKPDYRGLSKEIIDQNPNHYPVVSVWAWQFDYYFRKFNAGYELVNPLTVNFSEWSNDKQEIWVILPQYHLNEAQLSVINAEYELDKELTLNQINATLFKRKLK